MYLSRLILESRNRDVRRDLGGYQDLHRTVLALFPQVPVAGEDARQHFGVLFRVETDSRTGVATLLIQSREAPDFSRLPVGYTRHSADLVGIDANPDCKSVDAAYAGIGPGVQLTFRLRANPTKKVDTKTGPDGRKRNGRRVDLRGEQDHWKWLARKGDQAGFRLLSVHTRTPIVTPLHLTQSVPDVRVAVQTRQFGKRQDGESGPAALPRTTHTGGKRLTFASVLFEGVLEVTDRDAFLAALEQGIGSGKAYGFGLLSVAPAPTAARIPAADEGSYTAARTAAPVG